MFICCGVVVTAQEINLFHQNNGPTQCAAATSYYFPTRPYEQDITSKNNTHLIETLVDGTVKKTEERFPKCHFIY